MRGIRPSRGSDIDSSFVAGVILTLVVLGLVRVGIALSQWVATSDAVAVAAGWATTPHLAPLELVVNLAPLIFIGVIIFMILGCMTVLGRALA